MKSRRFLQIIVIALLPNVASAIDRIILNVDEIATTRGTIRGVEIRSTETTNDGTLKWHAEADQVTFVEHDSTAVDAHTKTPLRTVEQLLGSLSGSFLFVERQSTSHLELSDLKILGGQGQAHIAYQSSGKWLLSLDIGQLEGAMLARVLNSNWFANFSGNFSLNGSLAGDNAALTNVDLVIGADNLSLQTKNDKVATDKLALTTRIIADGIDTESSQFEIDAKFTTGGVFFDPAFVEFDPHALTISSHFTRSLETGTISHLKFNIIQNRVFSLLGQGQITSTHPFSTDNLKIRFDSGYLDEFFQIYAIPHFETTSIESLSIAGSAAVTADIDAQGVSAVNGILSAITINDKAGRIKAEKLYANLNWQRGALAQKSWLAWHSAELFKMPIGAASLDIITTENNLRLAKETVIPVIDGSLVISQFEFERGNGGPPEIRFDGLIRDGSLTVLSKALGWPEIPGTVSGVIPGLTWQDGALNVGGELSVAAFGGEVRIDGLSVAGLSGDYPLLQADITIDDLDLSELTQIFEFGSIEGRLDGHVRDLHMENWQPVSFDAWFGTPPEDDSNHRISQKAVENLTNIGGGAATEVLSRGVMRFFDNFSYDLIGIGCRLQSGICDLNGSVASETGFYIIKGGGVPRIDVIGYNRRIDWPVLVQRLKRISTADRAVVN